jgi:nucleoside-diphosphate-sugar epimerase
MTSSLPSAGTRSAVVFGGAGFIGTRLLAELVRSGSYPRIVSADFRDPKRPVAGVDYLECDVREPISIPGELPGLEIYNLAAVHTTPGHEDWEYFWTNVLGAVRVCEFATAQGCPLIVFTSSISVYGPSEEPLDENSPLRPESAYGRSKLQAEEIQRSWRRAAPGRRVVVVRPAVIYGPGEGGNFTRLAKLLKKGRFVYPARKDTIKSCGYVGELVRSIEFVRDLGLDEVTYNFAYPERYTTEDICQAFADVAGYGMPKTVVPLQLMLAGGLGFEILGKVGLKTSTNRARVMKLVNSTNIVPGVLPGLGYAYDTDLVESLRRWRKESPTGEFI